MRWLRPLLLALCVIAQSGADFIPGAQWAGDQEHVIHVGYAHRTAMRGGVKADAQFFVLHHPEWAVNTSGIGVLDPAGMWSWPNELVPDVTQMYSMVVPVNWKRGQLHSLNSLFLSFVEQTGVPLGDVLPRRAFYEGNIDGQWLGYPFLLSSRSTRANLTSLQRCSLKAPPPVVTTWLPGDCPTNATCWSEPYSRSFTWEAFRDMIVGLQDTCSIKKGLIMEECMLFPWLLSVLHSNRVFLIDEAILAETGKISSAWRAPRALDVFYEIVWPIIRSPAQDDMVCQWMNCHSPIMAEYIRAAWHAWPAERPAPLPRSECRLALPQEIEGFSTHCSGAACSSLPLHDSPGTANSFQSWYWVCSTRFPAKRKLCEMWIRFFVDYSNPDLVQYDLARFTLPTQDTWRYAPDFAPLRASAAFVVNERLLQKGVPLAFPQQAPKYLHEIETWGTASRLVADVKWRCPKNPELGAASNETVQWSPANWGNEALVKRCLSWALERAAVMTEYILMRDCRWDTDTEVVAVPGEPYMRRQWAGHAEVTCRITEESQAEERAAFATRDTPVPCDASLHVSFELLRCNEGTDEEHAMAVAKWGANGVGTECLVTNASLAQLARLNHERHQIACPYVYASGKLAITILAVSITLLFAYFGLAAFVYLYRRAEAIRAASWVWTLMMQFGCILLQSASLAEIGERTGFLCRLRSTLLSYGLVIGFASLIVKLNRVRQIFQSRALTVRTDLSDKHLALPFFGLILINSALLAASFATDNGGTHSVVFGDSFAEGIATTECHLGHEAVIIVWLVFIALLVIATLAIVVSNTRSHVSDRFNETRVMTVLAYLTAFIFVIGIPVLTTYAEREHARALILFLLESLVALSASAMGIGYKIYRMKWSSKDPAGANYNASLVHGTRMGTQLSDAPLSEGVVLVSPNHATLTAPARAGESSSPANRTNPTDISPVNRTNQMSPVRMGNWTGA